MTPPLAVGGNLLIKTLVARQCPTIINYYYTFTPHTYTFAAALIEVTDVTKTTIPTPPSPVPPHPLPAVHGMNYSIYNNISARICIEI